MDVFDQLCVGAEAICNGRNGKKKKKENKLSKEEKGGKTCFRLLTEAPMYGNMRRRANFNSVKKVMTPKEQKLYYADVHV